MNNNESMKSLENIETNESKGTDIKKKDTIKNQFENIQGKGETIKNEQKNKTIVDENAKKKDQDQKNEGQKNNNENIQNQDQGKKDENDEKKEKKNDEKKNTQDIPNDEPKKPNIKKEETTTFHWGVALCALLMFFPFGGQFAFLLTPLQAMSPLFLPFKKRNFRDIELPEDGEGPDRLITDNGENKFLGATGEKNNPEIDKDKFIDASGEKGSPELDKDKFINAKGGKIPNTLNNFINASGGKGNPELNSGILSNIFLGANGGKDNFNFKNNNNFINASGGKGNPDFLNNKTATYLSTNRNELMNSFNLSNEQIKQIEDQNNKINGMPDGEKKKLQDNLVNAINNGSNEGTMNVLKNAGVDLNVVNNIGNSILQDMENSKINQKENSMEPLKDVKTDNVLSSSSLSANGKSKNKDRSRY